MQIEKNRVVSLHYKLQKADAEGDLIEESYGGDPLTFLFGVGQMLPAFEENLQGKEAGEKFAFGLKSEDAYGDYNEQAVVPVDKQSFVIDGKLAEDMLKIGNSIPMRDQEGNQLIGRVADVQDQVVVMDFNHPMAGVDLYFTGNVEKVREATDSELEHGHVHGKGGVEH